MDTPVIKSRGRPRKRRREDSPNKENHMVVEEVVGYQSIGVNNVDDREVVQNTVSSRRRGRPPKKRVVEMSGVAMVGRYVLKEFDGSGVFLGKIVSYDSGLYRVNYEDGDCEDLDSGELQEFVIGDERQRFVGELLERRKNLDEAIKERNGIKLNYELENGLNLENKLEDGVKLTDKPEEGVNMKDELEKDVNLKDKAEEVASLKDRPEEGVHLKDRPEEGVILKDGLVKVLDVESPCALENFYLTKSNDIVGEGTAGKVVSDLRMNEVPTLNDFPLENVSGSATGDNDDGDKDEDYCFEDDETDSSSDYCEYGQGWEIRADTEFPAFPPPELPPSSGTIGVPEEYVSHLFSVHGFLRTYSVHLFLSPFTLDDLVGCLKCMTSNSLLDAIHVALLRVLRRHLERLASEGSQLASKCLKALDWDLLDILTWPVYLVNYLMAMGNLNGSEWKGFYIDVLEKEYYTLPVGIKLSVLQILCDDTLDAEEIRSEIDTQVESDGGVGFDGISSNPSERGPIFNSSTFVENNISFTSTMAKSANNNGETDNAVEDDNGDECRLCGMEGMLICCDGCPSAYHSRCIGVNKLSIPNGKWFCPECTISSIGPPITNRTSLRGAEVFGLDSFAQLFLGTCSHLLVLKVSLKASSFVRYYNRDDVAKVISVLSSCPYHSVSYLGICQGISKYWGLPQVIVAPLISNKTSTILDNKDDYGLLPFHPHPSDMKRTDNALHIVGNESYTSSVGESSIYEMSGFGYEKPFLKSDSDAISVGAPIQSNSRSIPYSRVPCVRQNATQKKKDTCLYMGSVFKPLAYINNYVHGAYAASAAANFASLSSDENQASEVHASDPRKAMAANVSLQAKAFSSAAVRFFWPSTEKKLFEIPRERCSWCFHCKAPVTYRKGCLLNQAAVSATRAEMKFILGLRLEKIGGGLYGIAAYTLYMEESCRGLILGSFRSSSYREQWRKKVEQASTCSDIKPLLLDLERNLCMIALSSEWTRLVDTWTDECSVPQSAAASGSVQKRVAGKRKKQFATPEVTDDDHSDSKEFTWWRGGKLAKLLFQRGTFPRQVLRKAACQGASRILPEIYYADGSDVPKRSRQFIWRAGVEMAKNASQLALQVRYLDQHIKWSDLVRPEQNPVDGKGPETEAFAFRNAHICDKKFFESKNIYGVAFGHQKHLSSRLMKSIIEKEVTEDGKHKYWFPEARIPLYLIKEYEEKAENLDLSPPIKPDCYSKHQRRQLKASRRDIFVYLTLKRDDLHVCPCASCHKDVFLELAVTCNACEGYCHSDCMLSSTELPNKDIEFKATCKQCSLPKFVSQLNNSVESPTSPLVMQGKDFQNSAAVSKSGKLKSSSDSKSRKNKSSKSEKQSSLHRGLIWKKKKGSKDDGSDFRLQNIICKGSSDGSTVSPVCCLCNTPYSPNLTYIRCISCEKWHHAEAVALDDYKLPFLVGFKCCRCRRMRSPDCPYADLPPKNTEVKRLRVNGPKEETVEADSISEAISEQAESFPSTPSLIGIEDDIYIDMDDDSLSLPVSQVQMPEPKSEVDFEWNNFEPGPQKLEVRRQVKNENDDDGLTWADLSSAQLPTSTETIFFPNGNAEGDACNQGLEDGTTLNYDSLNFESDYEPQTYFSFTELLETDGSNQLEAVDASREVWDDFPCEYSQNGFMEQCNVSSFDDFNPKISTEPPVDVRCEVCQVTTPAPDLGCQICGIQIHYYCLPREEVCQGNSWICGQCREWS